jgi:uncharacterized protein YdeI (YjbR/CyaY-like superfamily)
MQHLNNQLEAHYFETQTAFREWLDKHHASEKELLVGFYKKGSGKPSMTWPESVDQALCYGWIDGVRRSVDDERYTIRFTPRKPSSIWSNVNIAKVADLKAKGLMQLTGLAAFEKRNTSKSGIYSFENEAKKLASEYEKIFKSNKKAWAFFTAQPPGYKKLSIDHVMNAKQEKTQLSRLQKLIAVSETEKRLV